MFLIFLDEDFLDWLRIAPIWEESGSLSGSVFRFKGIERGVGICEFIVTITRQ
jgi:hypothetical protein